MKRFNLSLLLLGPVILTGAAHADENHAIQHYSYSLDDINEVEINGGVGEMEIVHTDGDEIKIELELEGKRRYWIMNKRSVSEIELVQSTRGDKLKIGMNDDDVKHVDIHWRIELPSVARTKINLGVGRIEGEFADTELELDVGVGAADIAVARSSAGRLELHSGVGSAYLHGANNLVSKRAFTSEQTYGYGDGQLPMEFNVGVGEMKVRLTDNTLVSF